MKRALPLLYAVGCAGTFLFLTLFDGFVYTWWNWAIALPVNSFVSSIWPVYWLVLRPLFH